MELCAGPLTPTHHLENQQALVKQFAEILEFTLKFDEYKVSYLRVFFWNRNFELKNGKWPSPNLMKFGTMIEVMRVSKTRI